MAPLAGTALEGTLKGPLEEILPLAFIGAGVANKPAACASPADNSSEFMRTSLSASPGVLGWASWFTFSWKDWALAAAAAGGIVGATGLGRFSTSTRVRIEIARVVKLTIRCSFTGTPPPCGL